jgi:hypothetical protein
MRGWPARRHTHGAVTSSNDRSRGRRAGGGVVVGPVPLLFPLRREEADQPGPMRVAGELPAAVRHRRP